MLQQIQTELKAPKGQTNSFGKYKYRSCEDILEAVKPLLAKHELALTISDEIIEVSNRVYVKATATLSKDGQCIATVSACAREAENKKGMDDAQITGAASSYARKYALNGLFCIDDTKDADATNDHGKRDEPANFEFEIQGFNNEVKSCKSAEQVTMVSKDWAERIGRWCENDKAEARKTVSHRKDEFNAS